MTQRQTLHNALPILCAAYARKVGVDIVIGGQSAYTNGKTIVLPNIPDTWDNFDALWGYLAHEAAHVRFTDWDVDFGRGLLKSLFNIFEDCRIEQAMIGLYPGMAHTLNEVARYMSHAGHYQIPTTDTHPAAVLESYCLYYVQCRYVGQHAIKRELEETEKVFRAVFPQGAYVRLQALFRRVPAMVSTQDAVGLAKAVLAMLEDEARKEADDRVVNQPPQLPNPNQGQDQNQNGDDQSASQGQSQKGDDSQDGDDQGASQGQSQKGDDGQDGDDQGASQGQSSKGDDGQDGDDQGASQGQSQKGDDGQDGDDQGASQGQSQIGDDSQDGDDQGASQGQSQKGDDSQDGDDQGASQGQSQKGDDGHGGDDQGDSQSQHQKGVIARTLDATDDDHLEDAHECLRRDLESVAEPGTPLCTTIHQPDDSTSLQPSAAEALKQRVRLTSSSIRSQLMGLVQSEKRNGDRTARSGNRLDSRRLTRLRLGDTRIFKKRVEKKAINTAVHLLVDMSYSMRMPLAEGSIPYQVANEASLALALGLESINGVNTAVTYFNGSGYTPVTSVIKHGQSVANNSDRFQCLPQGSTPMAEAVWYAGFELLQQREERKLIVIVTDGEPDSEPAMRDVVSRCEASGMDLIGIGIGSNSIKSFVKQSTVINRVEDLQKTLFELIGASLLRAS